ncbi:HK97 family phage prohead protease [Deferribacter abyssi]
MATEAPVPVFDWERFEVVDEILLMDGLKLPDNGQVPLLDTHSKYDTSTVIGSVRNLRIEGDKVLGRSVFSSLADDVFTKVKEGHLTDVSAGYRVNKAVWIPEGESQVINGRTFEGPVKVVTDWVLREVSVVPIGADEFAKVREEIKEGEKMKISDELRKFLVAKGLPENASDDEARAFMDKLGVKEGDEKKEEKKATNGERKVVDLNEEQRKRIEEEARRAERERVNEIRAMCEKLGMDEQFERKLIDDGVNVDEARKMIMEQIMKREETYPSFRASVLTDERDKFRSAATDSLLMRAGLAPEKPAAGADELMGYSLRELAREALRIRGERIPGNVMEMVGRALTTSDFPIILSDSANKSLLKGYEEAEETWQKWCGVGSVSDFKIHTLVRPGEIDDLDEIPESGEYKHGKREETFEQYQIAKYGKLFAITREAIINDDLQALTDIPRAMGEAAARKIGDVVYAVLIANSVMGDGKPIFDAAHKNILTTGSVDVSTIASAIALMKKQKDVSGKRRLNIRPRYFIAPVSLEGTAEQFFNSQFEGTQANPNKVNPYAGNYFERIYDARLDDDSETAFYLAGPKGKTVTVFFLNGIQTPYLESKQGWSVDGIEYKVRIECGAKAVDYRALVKKA